MSEKDTNFTTAPDGYSTATASCNLKFIDGILHHAVTMTHYRDGKAYEQEVRWTPVPSETTESPPGMKLPFVSRKRNK